MENSLQEKLRAIGVLDVLMDADSSETDKANALRDGMIELCRDDIEFFIDNFGHIEDKDADDLIQPFRMWDAQREALHSIMDNRKNIILKARQLGFSWLMMHIASWYLTCFTGRTVVALSRTEDEAKELIRRVEVILSNIDFIADGRNAPPGWSGITYIKTSLEVTVSFPNKQSVSVIKAFPSSPNAGRSFTADLIVIDEWAFQDFAEEIWIAAYPVINRPSGGKVIGLSTIKRGSLFETLFTDVDNGFNKIFIPWFADPKRTQEWYDETKRSMGDAITQEYPATIEEALTVPGGAFFPEVNEKNTITKDEMQGKVLKYVAIDYGLDMFSAHWFTVDMYGNAQCYREYDKSDLTISEAAGVLLSINADENIEMILAPPDLWNRSQATGKSRAQLWEEAGVTLTKTSNDIAAGCAGMKEWLKPRDNAKSRLTILDGCAPNLYRCLKKIQRDKRKPNVYAKDPHDLTHDVDSLRYFCVWWTDSATDESKKNRKRWTSDMIEDYENASDDMKQMIIARYGEPHYEDI